MRLGIVTDSHLAPEGAPPGLWHNAFDFDRATDHLRRALADLVDQRVDAIAMLGDLTNGGDPASLRRGLDLIAETGLPTLLVAGNHDHDEGFAALAERTSRWLANSVTMAGAAGQQVGGIRMVGLPIAGGGYDPGWLLRSLPVAEWGTEPVVVLSHFPVVSREREVTAAGLPYAGDFDDQRGLVTTMLARQAPTVVVHGHLHVRDAVAVGSLLQIGCAGLIEPPHEVSVLEMDANTETPTVRVEHRTIATSPMARSPILAPATNSWAFRDGWQAIG